MTDEFALEVWEELDARWGIVSEELTKRIDSLTARIALDTEMDVENLRLLQGEIRAMGFLTRLARDKVAELTKNGGRHAGR